MSPYCRNVREAATLLDIDVLFKPCERRHRLEVILRGHPQVAGHLAGSAASAQCQRGSPYTLLLAHAASACWARPEAQEVSPEKKLQFPLMSDPNSGEQ